MNAKTAKTAEQLFLCDLRDLCVLGAVFITLDRTIQRIVIAQRRTLRCWRKPLTIPASEQSGRCPDRPRALAHWML
jgi:hypothetical protein